MNAYLQDRFGRSLQLKTKVETISDILALNRVPETSVVLSSDGAPVTSNITPSVGNNILAMMLRTYHLPELLNTPVTEVKLGGDYYIRREFITNEDGTCRIFEEHLSKEKTIERLEEIFEFTVEKYSLIESGQKYVLGLSGGRDSLALFHLLIKLMKQKPFDLIVAHLSVTVPAFETSLVRRECSAAGVKYIELGDSWVEKKYGCRDLEDVLKFSHAEDGDQFNSINWLHAITCAALEDVCKMEGANKILYGLMREDVAASALRRIMAGEKQFNPLSRTWGGFEYIYPIWYLSKSDIYHYVRAKKPLHSHQSEATKFERGGAYRDRMYLITDILESAQPGVLVEIIEGLHTGSASSEESSVFTECDSCGATILENEALNCSICVNLKGNSKGVAVK